MSKRPRGMSWIDPLGRTEGEDSSLLISLIGGVKLASEKPQQLPPPKEGKLKREADQPEEPKKDE